MFDKKTLGLSEWKVEVKSAEVAENSKLFLTLLVQTKKKIFPKKGIFNKVSNPSMLYHSKIGPVRRKKKIQKSRTVRVAVRNPSRKVKVTLEI